MAKKTATKKDLRSLLSEKKKTCRYCENKHVKETLEGALQLMLEEPEFLVPLGTLHRKIRSLFPGNETTSKSDSMKVHLRKHVGELFFQVYGKDS